MLDVQQTGVLAAMRALNRRPDSRPIVGVNEARQNIARAHRFVRFEPTDGPLLRRHVHFVGTMIVIEDADVRHAHGLTQPLLAFAQRPLGLLEVRDVADDRLRGGNAAVTIADRLHDRAEPDPSPVDLG